MKKIILNTENNLDINMVKNAYRNIYYDTEKHAKRTVERYVAKMECLAVFIQNNATDKRQVEASQEIFNTLKSGYLNKVQKWLSAQSRCASSVITGGSGYNVARQEKRNDISHNREGEMYHYSDNLEKYALKSLDKIIPKTEKLDTELVEYRQKLEDTIKSHEFMKATNKFFKKEPDTGKRREFLINGGFSDGAAINDITMPKWGKAGFSLTGNTANIKRMKTRLESMEYKHEARKTGNIEKQYNGLKVVKNFSLDRLQLIFDGKPETDIMKLLKKHGFKWSPSNTAWQRQLTGNAMYSFKLLINDDALNYVWNK